MGGPKFLHLKTSKLSSATTVSSPFDFAMSFELVLFEGASSAPPTSVCSRSVVAPPTNEELLNALLTVDPPFSMFNVEALASPTTEAPPTNEELLNALLTVDPPFSMFNVEALASPTTEALPNEPTTADTPASTTFNVDAFLLTGKFFDPLPQAACAVRI